MPTYEYRCPEGHLQERVSSVANYRSRVGCDHKGCGYMAERYFSVAPMGFVQSDVSYRCPITDKPITSRREHEANLALHGCRILEPGEREGLTRQRAAEDAAFDSRVEATAEEFVAGLSAEKKVQLGKELDAGADVSIDRI